jgi:MFS family permease
VPSRRIASAGSRPDRRCPSPLTPTHATPADRSGYFELVRSNGSFRRLWLADIASHLGDWFNVIAIYTLVERLTGSPLALGLVFITKSLPFALASPLAGVIADRVNRRHLMIASDLARALVVLGLLFVREPADVLWIYVLGALQMIFSAAFIPARSASIPNVTTPRELLTANALSAATWSVLLAVGAALGGFVTEWIGVHAVFIIDSATYVISAWFVWRTVIPQATDAPPEGALVRVATRQLLDGWRHMWREPRIGRIALTKTAWAIGGGGLVYMLALFGQRLLPESPSIGIGWLYAARGLGTGLGPIIMRTTAPARRHWPRLIGFGIAFTGVAYLLIAQLTGLWVLVVLVTLAHSTSGANWVASTVLLQERTADRFRGRVFATEWLTLTLVDSAAIVTASLLLEKAVLTLRQGIAAFALLQILTGTVWLLTIARREAAADRRLEATSSGPSKS